MRPIYVWINGSNAGPFKQADYIAGCQDILHNAEFLRLGIEMGYGLVCRDPEPEFIR
jgi:hypothetical protein